MSRRRRFYLVHTTCRRCGIPLMTGNRSLFGADTLKANYDRLCEGCTSEEERRIMLEGQAAAALRILS